MAKANQSPESKPVASDWLYGIPPEEKDSFIQTLRNSTYVLDKLKAIITRKLASIEIDKEDDYEKNNWAVLRADRNGQVRMLKEIYRLLP